jgi:undecaprenyl-phosphate 4-deoxy-4-formamido-L-arabinose transferase
MLEGYSSTIAIMLLLGGIIMMLLGIIGEYVGCIFICLNNQPQYVIRRTVNFDGDKTEPETGEKK